MLLIYQEETFDFQSDGSDSEPPSKVRKTSSVLLDAADGKDNKVVLDNVPDNTMNLDEVSNPSYPLFQLSIP